MRILTTPTFDRVAKKLHRKQKADLDTAVAKISDDPEIGEDKVGDLAGVRVFKFRISKQEYLLSYRVVDEDCIKLLALGSHENYYRDLKRQEH
jgi:addiction module RelE/StbE family toxin